MQARHRARCFRELSIAGGVMRACALSIALATLAVTASAEARPSTTTMSCGQAAATVARAGAIVLTTGEFTYERFVATSAFCLPGEITEAGDCADHRFSRLPSRLCLPAARAIERQRLNSLGAADVAARMRPPDCASVFRAHGNSAVAALHRRFVPQSPVFTQDDIPVLDGGAFLREFHRRERAVGSTISRWDFRLDLSPAPAPPGCRNASRAVGKAKRAPPDGPMLHERRPNRSMGRWIPKRDRSRSLGPSALRRSGSDPGDGGGMPKGVKPHDRD